MTPENAALLTGLAVIVATPILLLATSQYSVRSALRARLIRLLSGRLNRASSAYFVNTPPTYMPAAFDTLRAGWIHGSQKNLLDPVRLHFIATNVERLDDVPGAFAELGVWKGCSAKVLASLKGNRRLYLFDTFAGFDDRDLKGRDANPRTRFSDTSLDAVRNFVGTDGVTYVPGWFPESITDDVRAERFAFVHIDCDLGAPTRAALEFFYPRMSPGGIFLIHDYGTGRWPELAEAVDSFCRTIPERPITLPDACCSAVIRKGA